MLFVLVSNLLALILQAHFNITVYVELSKKSICIVYQRS